MCDNAVPVNKVKKKCYRQLYHRNTNAAEVAIVERAAVKPLKKILENQITTSKDEGSTVQVVQNNTSKKCVRVTKKLCIPVCDNALNNTIKQDTKKINKKSNFCSSFQKKSEKPEVQAQVQSGKASNDAESKGKIREKVKQNKDKLTMLEKRSLLNESKASSDILHEQKEKLHIKKSMKSANANNFKETFPKYIPISKIKRILESQTSTNLLYIKGYIRINPKFNKHAYISMPNEEHDLLIIGMRDRNRALEGDLVVASINEEDKWLTDSNGKKQKTGTIVCVLEKIHSRKVIGCLKKVGTVVLLQPRDKRVPILRIYPESLPTVYNKTPSLFDNVLFLAQIKSWNKPHYVLGKIEHMIGTLDNIEVELTAIILENGINTEPFNYKLLKELPPAGDSFTLRDIQSREDWRHCCVFTIDPSTAVDLDDAVSCTVMTNGNYEVGVHIADVTHYLKFCSPLDKEVAKRATTVYLAHQVYHMLPKELCELCSLLPGQDKLTFSVIWEITPDAQIVNHRFAKSIINSCCQMTYEQAQMIIENLECVSNDILKIRGNFTPPDLCKAVENLFKLSEKIRIKRFANGALRIDQPKLHIQIDKESGLPISCSVSEQTDSNRLIEEFMLLANMTVATHLYKTIPEYALLRNHGNPSERILILTQKNLQRFGIHLDIESSGDLYNSIKRYELHTDSQSEEYKYLTKCRLMVINRMCAKAMVRATYNCSSQVKNTEELRHYALNVPFYTHFTSPIRRYPDIVVHRLLHSTLSTNIKVPANWNSKLCAEIAKNCNLRKYNAKLAEQQSNELYFTYLIEMTGQRIIVAIVFDVKEHTIEAILCDTGIKVKVFLKELENETTIKYDNEYSIPTLFVTWKVSNITQVITVFTIVHLRIQKDTDLFRLNALLVEPSQDHGH